MSQQQKMAWFTIAVCAVTLLAFAALWPIVGTQRAMAAFALLSLWGLVGWFYRKRPGEVVFDERDRDIHSTAVKISAGCVYLYFVSCSLVMWQLKRGDGSVPADWLPNMSWFGAIVLLGSWALAALVLYRREAV